MRGSVLVLVLLPAVSCGVGSDEPGGQSGKSESGFADASRGNADAGVSAESDVDAQPAVDSERQVKECSVTERVAVYPDRDEDGYGDLLSPILACELPEGYTLLGGDCDDADPNAHPWQTDYFTESRSDGLHDFNCDGQLERLISLMYAPLSLCDSAETESECRALSAEFPAEGAWEGYRPMCGDEGTVVIGCMPVLTPPRGRPNPYQPYVFSHCVLKPKRVSGGDEVVKLTQACR